MEDFPEINKPSDIDRTLRTQNYVTNSEIDVTVFLGMELQRPILVEGEPGCGKTELAKALASALDTRLIRLQCYEGLDADSTLYEWDYLRQLLKIRMEETKKSADEMEATIYSEKYLLKRPLLEASLYDGPKPPVLLIDELDRADEEFEGFLLEFLGEFQVTVPEYGTFRAKKKPLVIITSNNTRRLGSGLKRRCFYIYLTYPTLEKELEIVKYRLPGINELLARQVVSVCAKIRSFEGISKRPGVAETIDWAAALTKLGKEQLDLDAANLTLGIILKDPNDLDRLRKVALSSIVAEVNNPRNASST